VSERMPPPSGSARTAAPCARCAAALGRSCCQAKDDEPLATLTRADVERIQTATHLARDAFVEEEVLPEAEARAYQQLRPAWRGYFRTGTVRLTLARAGGACVFFHAGSGCTLSPDLRPTACLLYPFEPRADGGWTLAVEHQGSVPLAAASGEPRCLAVEESEGPRALLRAFGMTEQSVRALGERLRAEVRAHGSGGPGAGRRPA
jgi:Fe-S-cluster containining protein